MQIVFNNDDFTESLIIGFKGKHQLPLLAVVKEYRDADGNLLGADMVWSTYSPIRFFRNLFKRLRAN